MQRMCHAAGYDKYLANPKMLVSAETRACPFCPDHHAMQAHGTYERFALVPDREERRIPVSRLKCARMQRTVSLLPDFCIPRRQFGPAMLGIFLEALLLSGLSLLAALRRVRPEAENHSTAQALRDGFTQRASRLGDYLASVPASLKAGKQAIRCAPATLRNVVQSLKSGFRLVSKAFVHHGLGFHEFCQLGLA